MTHTTPFSSVETWSEIRDFPNYIVSNQGRVQNRTTQRLVMPTQNSNGVVIVGLMYDRKQYKRSLALLVATEFVPQPQRESFDTPIHLNGDRADNCADNLTWRPLWFARKYMKQEFDGPPSVAEPIVDVETGEVYKDSWHAAIFNGVLDVDIALGMHNNTYVWPTGQVFRLA